MKLFVFLFWGAVALGQVITPTQSMENPPLFSDDIDFSLMEKAIERQLIYFNKIDLEQTVQFGDDIYKKRQLKVSLEEFGKLISSYKSCLQILKEIQTRYTTAREFCLQTLNKEVQQKFHFYKPQEQEESEPQSVLPALGETFYTAYYSPDLEASKVKDDVYKNPIYALPKEAELRSLSREEIDFDKKLEGHGYELLYTKQSLFDLYLFHVEGGGRVRIKQSDGSFLNRFLSYAGANGKKFRPVYHYMLEQGMITPENKTLEDQRRYLRENPDDRREVYASNPSYIFFEITEEEPLGVGDIPLTPGRSIAIDTRLYKQVGMIHFVKTYIPVLNERGEVEQKVFKRFFLSQDTGGAIRGEARVDLYMGYGRDAEVAANNTRSFGEQIILVRKND